MVHVKGGVDRPVTPPLAKVMTKTRFLTCLEGFWVVLGADRGPDPKVGLKTRKIPQNLKMRKKIYRASFDPNFFQASQAP